MNATTTLIQGVEVHSEGQGPVVLMLHGWPDTHRLWDGTVAALSATHRCVRFTLPGYDLHARGPLTLQEMTACIAAIADAVSPQQPITLLLHDWGCVFGQVFAAQHPQRVVRLVLLDIGDFNARAYMQSLSALQKLGAASYQVWLACAYKLGALSPAVANWLTRSMARALRCPASTESIHWQMNYPYAMTWFGTLGGMKRAVKVQVRCPTFFAYGERKPFMFHSPQWIEQLNARADCITKGYATGHWIQVSSKAAQLHQDVLAWLAKLDKAP